MGGTTCFSSRQITKKNSLIVRPSLDLSPPLLLSPRSLHHLRIRKLDACKSNMKLTESHSLSEKRSQLRHIGLRSLKLWGLQISNDWMAGLHSLSMSLVYCDVLWFSLDSIINFEVCFSFVDSVHLDLGRQRAWSSAMFSLSAPNLSWTEKAAKTNAGTWKTSPITDYHRSSPQPDQESRTFPFRLWSDVLSSGCGRGTYRRQVPQVPDFRDFKFATGLTLTRCKPPPGTAEMTEWRHTNDYYTMETRTCGHELASIKQMSANREHSVNSLYTSVDINMWRSSTTLHI